ncbi:DinB family protein [Membranicola marinus]|uniref:DinB family protein n=1 Tax=Membranihabitans marinus TaxID=1227546 RepID=A0A953LB83_9BACT|nr:DinB family protein [Membranihabitans marinus]MBY5958316.1 DinB family protein [Membranihabitans marinus]
MNEDRVPHELIYHLKMGQAFRPVEKIVNLVPFEKIGFRPEPFPYSFYELFWHIRFTQLDILNYCIHSSYEPPVWPGDYWPGKTGPNHEKEWEALKKSYFTERDQLADLIRTSEYGLDDRVAGQSENSDEIHTIFREVLLVIEHSAYHTGQLVMMGRMLGVYPRRDA